MTVLETCCTARIYKQTNNTKKWAIFQSELVTLPKRNTTALLSRKNGVRRDEARRVHPIEERPSLPQENQDVLEKKGDARPLVRGKVTSGLIGDHISSEQDPPRPKQSTKGQHKRNKHPNSCLQHRTVIQETAPRDGLIRHQIDPISPLKKQKGGEWVLIRGTKKKRSPQTLSRRVWRSPQARRTTTELSHSRSPGHYPPRTRAHWHQPASTRQQRTTECTFGR